MKKLVLIDGYSFLFRAFFAIRGLTRSDGTPVNGLYGFARMLIKIITEIEYTHIAVAFDTGKKTFRSEIYKEYKTNRPPCPPELIPQFPLVRELVKKLNIVSIEEEGYEADDVIATFTKKAEKENFDSVVIVSSDKDLMQLVDDKVLMFDGMKGEYVDIEKVKEKWGVAPKQVLDVLSLTGDTSDNVPGVPTIGPKTASELITKYENLENLLDHLDEIKQNKRREVLIENKDLALLSKKLITLDENVKTNISLDNLQFKQYNPSELLAFLKEQEFHSMVKGLEQAFNCIGCECSLFENNTQKDVKILSKNDLAKQTHIELKTKEEIEEKIKTIKDKFYFNVFEYEKNILSFAFAGVDEYIYFIKFTKSSGDLFAKNDGLEFDKTINLFKNIFENKDILKIGFDIKRQIKIFFNLNISIENFEDIEVLNYIANNGLFENNLHSIIENELKNNTSWYSSQEYKKLTIENKIELLKNIFKDLKNIDIQNNLFELSCFIIETFKPLYSKLQEKISAENLNSVYEEIEKPMTKILANMEIAGIKIDIKKMKELSKEFESHSKELMKQIYAIAGEEFNIASPKQLGYILFEKLGYGGAKKSKKTGNYSTNVEILEDLANQGYEICQKILMWRHYTKLKNTYTDTLPQMVDKNNRIHTTYSNTYVISGRLSSSDPNLQNIPIKTEAGGKIRTAFIAKEGCKLVSIDYKQAELRIIANYQNVKKLKEFFLSGKDIHKTTASKVFKLPEEDITSAMRSIAKAINFSIVYGTTSFGLAKRIGSSNEEAKEYLKNYFETYPEIKDYIENTKNFVKQNNYVKTMFDRKINIDYQNAKPILKGNLERLAINAPIQGTCADIIKKAMIDLDKKLQNYKSKMILQIHDELVLECPENEVDEVVKIVKESMENVVNWEVKLEVDVGVGDNLGEM